MKHFDYIMLFIVTLLIGQSCSDKVESISEDDTDMQHHATLVLNGSIAGYESSRAQDYNWRDGDKIFLQFFTSSDSRIRGVASYNAQLDVWNLEYNGNLPSGVSAKCEAYYFDGISDEISSKIDISSVYEDKSAAYLVENDVVSVFAVLSPVVGRIRLKGEPGTKFLVFGFNSITDYDIYSNTFDVKEAYISSEIGNDGYSPYFYGTFPSEEQKQIFLMLKSGTNASHTYTQYLDTKALSKGHSGYVTLPSEIEKNGWEETSIKGCKAGPYTVAEAIEKQGYENPAWVTGYIVGAVAPYVVEVKSSDDIEFCAPTILDNTLVIADAADVKDVVKCIVFELPQGSQLRSVANLRSHPELLGKTITIKGKFSSYMGTYGLIGNSGGYDEFFFGGLDDCNSITLDFSTLGFENATAVTDVTMSDGTVLTFGNGTNTSNAPKYYTATGGVRMYANNTLNIKASGKTITGVKLTCDSYNGTDYVGNDTLNGKSGSTTVIPSVSGTTVTFSGFSGSELLITNSYAQASGGVQLRIKTITVYYAN